MHQEEQTLWQGHPSHVKDLGFHLACLLFSWLIVPLGMMLWRYLDTRFHQHEVTSERIRITRGILSKRMDELELYRVKDTSIDQPFFLRLFKLANVVIRSSDASTPVLTLQAIAEAKQIRENIRGCVEKLREKKRVREVDYV